MSHLKWPVAAGLAAIQILLWFPGNALSAAPPAAPKKVLFFSKSASFQHSVIRVVDGQPSHVEKVLTELGAAHNIQFTFTKDGTIFTPAGLAPFDAVFFYTTGDLTQPGNDGQPPMSVEGKQALLDFVASGKGFLGAHSATDTFHTPGGDRFRTDSRRDPYIAMLGGEFITHGSQQSAKMRVADPKFPGIAAAGAGFDMMEEWYSLKNFQDDLHVLLVQDTEGMTGNKKGNPYDRPSYPATWIRPHGKGRVFYTSMGHKPGTWTTPVFQSLLLGGLDWATGRVEADVTPNLKDVAPGYAKMPPGPLVPSAAPTPEEEPVAQAAVPVPTPQSAPSGNLALQKAVTASGSQGGAKPNPAKYAVDGNAETYWASKGLDFPQWFQVDLGKTESVRGSRIEWSGKKDAYLYVLEGSTDGNQWTTLHDGSQNTRTKVVEDKFDARDARYVRLTLKGITGSPHVRPGIKEFQVLGVSAPAVTAAAPAAKAASGNPNDEQTLLNEIIVPEGFQTTIFAAPPMVNYPTFVAAAPDGTVFVSCDKNGAGGRLPDRGRIMRLRDTNGDGRAEEAEEFVKSVDSPRGLIWDHDRLYVMHPPHLSAYVDTDGDGTADKETVLVKNIGWSFKDRSGDHASDGITIGIDGWIYCAIGDFGFFDAEGTDGRKVQLRGGGIVRVRPDGTGLEIYSRGTRNVYEAAVDPLLNVFGRDNNNDGTWGILLHHYTGLENHGYPTLFRNFADEVIAPLADYVTGSGSGALYLDEPGFPEKYRGLLTCDWGKSWVYQHPLKPKGATFTADQTEFISVPRTIDIKVDAMSRLYVASWRGAIFNYSNENVGYIAQVSPKGYKSKPLPDVDKMSPAVLVKELASPSHIRRLSAQRALLRKGLDDATATLLVTLAKDNASPLVTRVAALFTLKQGLHAKATGILADLAADATLRPFAIRAMTDSAADLSTVPAQPILAALGDSAPRTKVEAIVAIGRLGKSEHAAALSSLLSDLDPVIVHTAVQVLSTLKAVDVCWKIVDDASAKAPARAAALRVLQIQHEADVVDGFLSRLGKEKDVSRRRGLLTALCRLHFREGQWTGAGWGLTPDVTGPYFQFETWEKTPAIAAVLREEVTRAKGDDVAFIVAELNRHQIHFEEAVQAIVALALQNKAHVPAAVYQLAHSSTIPAAAIPLLVSAASDAAASDEVRGDAVVSLARTESAEGFMAALSVFAEFEKKPRAEKKRSRPFSRSRAAFFSAPALSKQQDQFVAEAAKMNDTTSAWADAALLKIAAARPVLEAAWSAPKRRIQILRAIAYTSDRSSKDKILLSLTDPDAAVAKAAREAARDLRIDVNAKPGKVEPLIATLKPEAVVAHVVKMKGDVDLGEQLFTQQLCITCHTVSAEEPLRAGPFLGGTAGVYQRAELAEMVLNPSKSLAQGYEPHHVVTKSGAEHVGFVAAADKEKVILRDMAKQETIIATADIVKNEQMDMSLMPPGLAGNLTEKEFASLLSYLESLVKH